MALLTGEADLREGDYYGSAVNRCARLRSAGHGGQILFSQTTADLVRGTLPAAASLRDLGTHRLKDLAVPETVYQLDTPGLPDAFPPLKTLDARPNNLPVQLTSFVGREREVGEVVALLPRARLVTLTGPGGTGKTRLALQAAAATIDAFPDGVFFVDLAPLADPALVPSAVAQALGVQGLTDTVLRVIVLRFLRDKQVLLVLDNYEHLLAAAEFAGAMLQAAPQVRLIVTSRAPLRVTGEQEYMVAPLPLPDECRRSLEELGQNPAVQLFVQRAQAVRGDFALSEETAADVVAICARLDGLPLALELAAARVRALPVAALLTRLEQRLPLLTGGRRDLPARQQTLRAAIAWSYDVLEPAEQRLFRRLGVFAGGCTLELAEAVCNADGDLDIEVLDSIGSLVEKSLVHWAADRGGEPRYRMLETIREFALGELEASGEGEAVRRQLAMQVLQLARQFAAANDWLRLDAELGNARAVLGWCVERADVVVGVRLLWALRWYLYIRGRGNEQQVWRRRLLALPEATQPTVSRARLLALSPADLFSITDQDRAVAALEEAIGLSRQLGDTQCLAAALERLALLRLNQNNPGAVVPLAEEAVALRLQAGAVEAAVVARSYLITVAVAHGDIATAERLVAADRALAGTAGTAVALFSEALLAVARGDDAQVRVLLEDYVQRVGVEQGGKGPDRLVGLTYLAWVAFRQGDTAAAVATCVEILAAQRELGPSRFLPAVLSVLAQAAERCGLLAASARLLAATDVERREFAAEVFGLHEVHQAAVERVHAALGEAAFAAAWAAGATLSADAAIELGFAVVAQLQELLTTRMDLMGSSRRPEPDLGA
ncbi:MAG TPA: AAA family ATPase, partial [Dehalococcoidia bacterium]|nr:AAA family ATPase [Dehalococcoidia bacterium]